MSSLCQCMKCAAYLDWNLVSAVWPGKDVHIFYIAECVDFYVVEHYEDEFNTHHQSHFGRVTNTAVLPGSGNIG